MNEPDTIKCPECESSFTTDLRFKSHKETMHVDTDQFKCSKCEFSSTNQLAISEHSQTVHMEIQVNIGKKEQTVIACDLCDYKCKYNIQLRKHLRAIHVMDQKYNCKECEYKTDYVANTWKHTLNQHPDKPLEFTREKNENDFVLKLVAEQNAEILEGMDTMKNYFREAFDNMAEVVGGMKDDTDDKFRTLADTVIKLHSKIAKLEGEPKQTANIKAKQRQERKRREMTETKTEPTIQANSAPKPAQGVQTAPPSAPSTAAPRVSGSAAAPPSAPSTAAPRVSGFAAPTPPAQTTPTYSSTQYRSSNMRNSIRKSRFLAKPKILYVGDSVGHTASLRNLEIFQNCRIRSNRAYSSVYDEKARWPKCNYSDVVKHAIENPGRERDDVLVMSAPTVDITNIDASKLQPADKTETIQERAIQSSRNMFYLAETTLRQNPNLTKVIIMEHPPRFDTPDVDPTSLKPSLARLANATMGSLLLNSALREKIHIGSHSLESSGAGVAHCDRFQNIKSGKYDGVHYYGEKGCTDYTNSVNTILMMALPQHNTAQPSAGLGTAQPQPANHTDPAQARHQRKKYHPTVKTSNRFSPLNQGN